MQELEIRHQGLLTTLVAHEAWAPKTQLPREAELKEWRPRPPSLIRAFPDAETAPRASTRATHSIDHQQEQQHPTDSPPPHTQ